MKTFSFHALRIGLAVTFLWVGILIFREPEIWGFYLRDWAVNLLPFPVKTAMLGTAILDIAIGILLLISIFTRLASFLAAVHLITVLITSRVDFITVHDIGLLGAAIALTLTSLPRNEKDD